MAEGAPYTTQLQAGLGLIPETKTLLELWTPGMSTPELHQTALDSGRFPMVTARRLRNVVTECFAPRYLVDNGVPAIHLQRLVAAAGSAEVSQLMFLFTSRANSILGDFVREIYWERYAGGYTEISTEDARRFVERAIDDGKTSRRWAESTVRRISAYLTGCCADFGLLEGSGRSPRRIRPISIAPLAAAYLAHDLHFAGIPDNALLTHRDWALFGLNREDVLAQIKRLSMTSILMLQAAGDVVRISWKQPNMEAVLDVLTQG